MIAVAAPEFQNPCVATGSILVTLSEFVKETLQRRNAGSARQAQLSALSG